MKTSPDSGRGQGRRAAAVASVAVWACVLSGGTACSRRLRAWSALFEPLGARTFVAGGGGVDVGPLVRNGSVPVSVIPDAQVYFDVHHSTLDVLQSVRPRELEFQAACLANLAYVLAEEGI